MTEGIKEQEEGKIKEPVCIEAIRTNASGMICFGIILEKTHLGTTNDGDGT